MVTQEIHFLGSEDTFIMAEDEASGAETFEDQVQETPVLLGGGGEDEDVIDIGDAEEKIAEDGVYHPLKDSTSVAKAKTGVVEGVGAEGRGDGSLRDVVWVHGDLVVALQEVQLGEDLGQSEPDLHR